MAVIELAGLWRSYPTGDGHVAALRDVTMTIGHGEFIAITGPSGSGKSTLLNILGLLDRPDRGAYAFDGRDATTLSSDQQALLRNRRLGFIFQSFNLIPALSVAENVALPLHYAGYSVRMARGRAAAVLDMVGLGDRLSHRPTQLSGGQQQRVAIARALVSDPGVLLADEPTGSLDRATGREVLAILRGLHDQGLTIVMVTHDEEVSACADRRIQFVDGRIAGPLEGGP